MLKSIKFKPTVQYSYIKTYQFNLGSKAKEISRFLTTHLSNKKKKIELDIFKSVK
jgi:hypothetical protein